MGIEFCLTRINLALLHGDGRAKDNAALLPRCGVRRQRPFRYARVAPVRPPLCPMHAALPLSRPRRARGESLRWHHPPPAPPQRQRTTLSLPLPRHRARCVSARSGGKFPECARSGPFVNSRLPIRLCPDPTALSQEQRQAFSRMTAVRRAPLALPMGSPWSNIAVGSSPGTWPGVHGVTANPVVARWSSACTPISLAMLFLSSPALVPGKTQQRSRSCRSGSDTSPHGRSAEAAKDMQRTTCSSGSEAGHAECDVSGHCSSGIRRRSCHPPEGMVFRRPSPISVGGMAAFGRYRLYTGAPLPS